MGRIFDTSGLPAAITSWCAASSQRGTGLSATRNPTSRESYGYYKSNRLARGILCSVRVVLHIWCWEFFFVYSAASMFSSAGSTVTFGEYGTVREKRSADAGET